MNRTAVESVRMSEGKPQTVTREQVKKHNSDKDIWIILHGRAYDITEFQNDHPGGPDILHGYAGETCLLSSSELSRRRRDG